MEELSRFVFFAIQKTNITSNQSCFIIAQQVMEVSNQSQQIELDENSNRDTKVPSVKTKKIEKKPKDGKIGLHSKQIIKNNREGESKEGEEKVRKGRPPQICRIEVKDDPTANIQQKILDYLDQIGLKHGLVFRTQDRHKLIKENEKKEKNEVKIEWNKDHEWVREKEVAKIKNNPILKNALESYAQLNKKLTYEDLVQIFLNIGDIAADQCTQQIYLILAFALRFITSPNKYHESQEKQEIRNLLANLNFLSGNFTKLRIQYWIQIKDDKELINKQFINLVKNLKEELQIVFDDPKSIKEFIEEQKLMDLQLQQIMMMGEKQQFCAPGEQ